MFTERSYLKIFEHWLLRRILVPREEMLKAYNENVRIIRKEYSFSPKYKNVIIEHERYSQKITIKPISSLFLCKISNITLIGPYGIPVTKTGKILFETTQSSISSRIRRTISLLGFRKFIILYIKALLPFSNNTLEYGFHLIPRHGYYIDKPNFCHWLLEDLPRLYAYDFINSKPKIITNKTLNRWQLESLDLMGIPKSNIYKLSNDSIRVNNFYLTNMRSASSIDSEQDPITRKWVANKLKNNISLNNSNRPKRVFISRQETGDRFFTNMDEIRKILHKYNIQILHTGNSKLVVDIEIFYNANLIIAPHGAGLANMIFSKNCHIIEIACDTHWKKDFFYYLSLEFDFTFDAIKATRVWAYEKIHSTKEAWHLDPNLLEAAILRYLNKS